MKRTKIMTIASFHTINRLAIKPIAFVCFLLIWIISPQGFGATFYWVGPTATKWDTTSAWKQADGSGWSAWAGNTYIIDPSQTITNFTANLRADTNNTNGGAFPADNLTIKTGGVVMIDESIQGVDNLTLSGGTIQTFSADTRTWGDNGNDKIILATGSSSKIAASSGTENKSIQLIVNATIEGSGDVELVTGLNDATHDSYIRLNKANTHSGTTTLTPKWDGGKLIIGNENALQNSTLNLNYSTDKVGTVTFNQDSTLGGLEDSGDAANLDFNGKTISIGNNDGDTIFDGTISNGGASSLIKIGTGTLTLTGNSTYDGYTTVNNGAIRIENDNALGTGGWQYEKRTDISATGRVELTGDITTDEKFYLSPVLETTNTPGLLNISGNNEISVAVSGRFDNTGTNYFNIESRGTAPGDYLTLSKGLNPPSTGVASGTWHLMGEGDGEISGAIQSLVDGSTIGLKKSGSGTWTLTGTNTYTGTTTVNEGTLKLVNSDAGDAIQVGGRTYVVNNPGTLEFNREGGGGVGRIDISGNGTWKKTGTVDIVQTSGSGGSAPCSKIAMGSGGLIHIAEGLYQFGEAGVGDWTGNLADLQVDSGATFRNRGTEAYVDGLSGQGTVGIDAGLILGVDGGDGIFSGDIQNDSSYVGDYSVTKEGGGTQTLTGTNTYTGDTTINGGTLLINGTNTSGEFIVNNGGTLGGTPGAALSKITVNTGGAIAPGNSIGEITLENSPTTFADESIYDWEFTTESCDFTSPTSSDLINADTLVLPDGGRVILNLLPLGYPAIDTLDVLTLFTYTTLQDSSGGTIDNANIASFFNVQTPVNGRGFDLTGLTFSTDGGAIKIYGFTYIPEPSTIILAGLGLMGITFRRRRK